MKTTVMVLLICSCFSLQRTLREITTLRKIARKQSDSTNESATETVKEPIGSQFPSDSKNAIVNHESNIDKPYFEITGFVGSWRKNTEIESIPIKKIDTLIYASFDVDSAHNTCVYSKSEAEKMENKENSFDSLRKLRKINSALKILANIGGSTFSPSFYSVAILGSEEDRKSLAANCIQFILKQGIFDGINLDLQFPCPPGEVCFEGINTVSPDDKSRFNSTVSNFSKALGESYILTVSVSADPRLASQIHPEIESQVNRFYLLTYDFRTKKGRFSGHHSAPYSSPSTENSTKKAVDFYRNVLKIPSEKLQIGAAFYGRGFKLVGSCDYRLSVKCNTEFDKPAAVRDEDLNYTELLKLKESGEFYFDSQAKAPILVKDDSFYSFENEESLKEKLNIVEARNLSGLFIWELLMDSTDFVLLNSIYKRKALN